MDEQEVDRVRKQLWKKIAEHQAAGGTVRNQLMADRFGGVRGSGWMRRMPSCVCLLGLYGDIHMNVEVMAKAALDISFIEARNLESGFEGWTPGEDIRLDHPLYKLGREIGLELEQREAILVPLDSKGESA